MKTITLSTKTFSKKAKQEVLSLLPSSKFITKVHVPGVGYTYFIKDAAKVTLAKVYMEQGQSYLAIN
jgi:hypothetical protein